ncbi:MAG TPA: DUF3037 domain-containing protein [Flavisolibacter sp.]|nr:DUF3037 domain-containing protein [Flavisolibacter sp.]
MQGKHLFEYAIIRIVPRVEREEFLNVGIILYCKDRKFLDTKYTINKERISALCAEVDCKEVEEHLQSFEKIAKGEKDGGSIAALDLPSRFRWLTATRSTIIQTSKVHPGFTEDPKETLEKLYQQLVL